MPKHEFRVTIPRKDRANFESERNEATTHSLDWEYGPEKNEEKKSVVCAKGKLYLYPTSVDCECFSWALLLPAKEVDLLQRSFDALNELRLNGKNLSERGLFQFLYDRIPPTGESHFPVLAGLQELIQYGLPKHWTGLEQDLNQLAILYEHFAEVIKIEYLAPVLSGESFSDKLARTQGRVYDQEFYRAVSSGTYTQSACVNICGADGPLSRILPRHGWKVKEKGWIQREGKDNN